MANYQQYYDQPQYPIRGFRPSATSRASLTDIDLDNQYVREESFYSREEMVKHAKEVMFAFFSICLGKNYKTFFINRPQK